jgi:ketosteroid isomerase-like protein
MLKMKMTPHLIAFSLMLIVGLSNEGLCGISRNGVDPTRQASIEAEIRVALNKMNEMLATKDVRSIMTIYDNSDDILVVGSDSGEVFVGRDRVQSFMKMIASMPFVFSFEMNQVLINSSQNVAWVFVDGNMVHTRSNGKVSKVPYRITAVMVKRDNEWKWKVFSGSIPRGE